MGKSVLNITSLSVEICITYTLKGISYAETIIIAKE
jgi:hypothetical protein